MVDSEAQIRKLIEAYLKERNDFFIHLVFYFAINLGLWLLYLAVSPGAFPWPLLVMFGWGIGVVAHYMDIRGKHPTAMMRKEQQIEDEIARIRRQMGDDVPYEKPKRSGAVRLSDDGELIYEDEERYDAGRST